MLHQVYKAKRALFARMYPTMLVFKDGSTITIRYPEPRQIIKQPLTYEECIEGEKVAWKNRRRTKVDTSVEIAETDVTFDARKYLRPRKRSSNDINKSSLC